MLSRSAEFDDLCEVRRAWPIHRRAAELKRATAGREPDRQAVAVIKATRDERRPGLQTMSSFCELLGPQHFPGYHVPDFVGVRAEVLTGQQ
jgi:hypothetical protein